MAKMIAGRGWGYFIAACSLLMALAGLTGCQTAGNADEYAPLPGMEKRRATYSALISAMVVRGILRLKWPSVNSSCSTVWQPDMPPHTWKKFSPAFMSEGDGEWSEATIGRMPAAMC